MSILRRAILAIAFTFGVIAPAAAIVEQGSQPSLIGNQSQALFSGTAAAPVASPTPYPNPPSHLPQYVIIQGCYHTNGGGSCPNVTPATDVQVGIDYSTLCNYVNEIETDQRAYRNIPRGNYCLYGPYLDPFFMHDRTPGQYPVDINLFTSAYGGTAEIPGANPNGSALGNIGAPTHTAYWTNACIDSARANSARIPVPFCRYDDTDYYGRYFAPNFTVGNPKTVCREIPSPTNSSTCAGSAIATVDQNPFFAVNGYTSDTYAPPEWYMAIGKLFRAAAPTKIIFNNAFHPGMYHYILGPNNNNVLGGECEGCITYNGYNSSVINELVWRAHLDTEVALEEYGVQFHCFHCNVRTPNEGIYLYASLALGMIDPRLTYSFMTPVSPISTPTSGIPIDNAFYVVPTRAIGPSPKFDPDAVHYPVTGTLDRRFGVGVFKTPGGAYAREFLDCYVNGVDMGRCAAVVNPTTNTVPWPQQSLTFSYQRSLANNENGVIKEFGDNGGVDNTPTLTGGAPPATLAPHTAVYAFN